MDNSRKTPIIQPWERCGGVAYMVKAKRNRERLLRENKQTEAEKQMAWIMQQRD